VFSNQSSITLRLTVSEVLAGNYAQRLVNLGNYYAKIHLSGSVAELRRHLPELMQSHRDIAKVIPDDVKIYKFDSSTQVFVVVRDPRDHASGPYLPSDICEIDTDFRVSRLVFSSRKEAAEAISKFFMLWAISADRFTTNDEQEEEEQTQKPVMESRPAFEVIAELGAASPATKETGEGTVIPFAAVSLFDFVSVTLSRPGLYVKRVGRVTQIVGKLLCVGKDNLIPGENDPLKPDMHVEVRLLHRRMVTANHKHGSNVKVGQYVALDSLAGDWGFVTCIKPCDTVHYLCTRLMHDGSTRKSTFRLAWVVPDNEISAHCCAAYDDTKLVEGPDNSMVACPFC